MATNMSIPNFNCFQRFDCFGFSSNLYAVTEACDDVINKCNLSDRVNQLTSGCFSKVTQWLPHASIGLYGVSVVSTVAHSINSILPSFSCSSEAEPSKVEPSETQESGYTVSGSLNFAAKTLKAFAIDAPAAGFCNAFGLKTFGTFAARNVSPLSLVAQSLGLSAQGLELRETATNVCLGEQNVNDVQRLMLRTAGFVCGVAALSFTITGLVVQGATFAVAAGAVFAAAGLALSLAENFLSESSSVDASAIGAGVPSQNDTLSTNASAIGAGVTPQDNTPSINASGPNDTSSNFGSEQDDK